MNSSSEQPEGAASVSKEQALSGRKLLAWYAANSPPTMSVCANSSDYWRAMYEHREAEAHALSEEIVRLRQFIEQSASPRGTDAQILKERELTVSAINGAMAFGYQGVRPPPEDDPRSAWLKPFWELGRKHAELESALQGGADWQPIETAPKDGREVILRDRDRVGCACWTRWPDVHDTDGALEIEGGEGWTVGADGDEWRNPTHWMPLPAPPGSQGSGHAPATPVTKAEHNRMMHDPSYRNCEFCGCLTNAKVRACCENGHAADRFPVAPATEGVEVRDGR